ncbi:MAG: Maf-like protein [Bacteroidaceae bacterium]|nr:Maf-like protein [Bacteroidaceae bacterium]
MKTSKRIILASNSPRRRELLAGLDIDFEVRVKEDIGEDYPPHLSMEEIPQYISRVKSEAYSLEPDELIITADTIVWTDNRVLGKPTSAIEAQKMLQRLSGKTHQVVTGVTLATTEWSTSFASVTDVTFASLSDEEIRYYVDRYAPMDKAGAYGVQEWIGYVGVTRLAGSYFNVMGLPVQRLYSELKNRNIIQTS